MGRKERAATGGYRAGPDSMWTCRASPAYEANRTPSSVPTGIPRSDLLGHISAWGIVDILVLTVFSNPIMRKPYLILNDLITSILRRNTNDDNRSERRL
jgi:hypothetical protein